MIEKKETARDGVFSNLFYRLLPLHAPFLSIPAHLLSLQHREPEPQRNKQNKNRPCRAVARSDLMASSATSSAKSKSSAAAEGAWQSEQGRGQLLLLPELHCSCGQQQWMTTTKRKPSSTWTSSKENWRERGREARGEEPRAFFSSSLSRKKKESKNGDRPFDPDRRPRPRKNP